MEKTIRFTLFADLHYKKRMYASTTDDLETIIDRAKESNSDLILHAGDLCNDYKGSPELIKILLENKYDLPVYGVYGNHELETTGNSMESVTPCLTNRNVNFASPDVGYYYFDKNGFRFICLDTNHSYLEGKWVHNLPASWGPPEGAGRTNALGNAQLEWLEKVLSDAEKNDLLCILVSHADLSGSLGFAPCYDWTAVRELTKRFNSKKKRVILSINGHYHTDHIKEIDGVIYFDCNTVRNGFWHPEDADHYQSGQTFDFQDYDEAGRPTNSGKLDLRTLSQARNTWFFTSPLSAVVTLTESSLDIEGSSTDWMYGVIPEKPLDGKKPLISSAHFDF